MVNSTNQGEKRENREKAISTIIVKMENLSKNLESPESLLQNMFDQTISAYLPVELQNIHPTLMECHILQMISENGPMNGSQLAKNRSMTRGGMTKVMAKLLEKNLVSREVYANNRKEIYYALTTSGKQITEIHEVLHKKTWEKVAMVLAEYDYAELHIFESILTKIANQLVDECGDFMANDT